MEVLTLVTHIKDTHLGIGVVAKKLKVGLRINFGRNLSITCKPTVLREVNVDDVNKLSFAEFQSPRFQQDPPIQFCIVGNELFEFGTTGWIPIRVILKEDLKTYPLVTNNL